MYPVEEGLNLGVDCVYPAVEGRYLGVPADEGLYLGGVYM